MPVTDWNSAACPGAMAVDVSAVRQGDAGRTGISMVSSNASAPHATRMVTLAAPMISPVASTGTVSVRRVRRELPGKDIWAFSGYTLETLLSSPAPRTQIIGAKMLAALIVAVIYAVVYGISFVVSMLMSSGSGSLTSVGVNGVTTTQIDVGSAFTELTQAHDAVQQLGLDIPGYGWVGVIAQLALTLAIALTAAIILGAEP